MHENTPPEGEASRSPLPDDLAKALAEAQVSPGDEEVWEKLEDLCERHQRPEEVEELFASLLGGPLDPASAERLGQRAVRFHDEWSGQQGPLVRVLSRLLEIDPSIGWAFERLTLVLTAGESWDELLSLYDRALSVAPDLSRRRELLDEAAHVAKDFAGQPDRAIGYLSQLFQMRPTDAKLASQLERLLESRARHADLVKLWKTRLTVVPAEMGHGLRLKVAQAQLDHLGGADEAVAAVEPLLSSRVEVEGARTVLERVGAQASASAETRARALGLLREEYARDGRSKDVLRVLEAQIPLLADATATAEAHRQAARLWAEAGADDRALEHHGAVLAIEPGDDQALTSARAAAEATGAFASLASSLERAAQACQGARASELLAEAARLSADRLSDEPRAARLYGAVFWAEESPEAGRSEAASRLPSLLERAGDEASLLSVLERIAADNRPEGGERRALLGRIATLATRLGELPRALAAWESRLADDASDEEARDARIDLLDRMKRHQPLLEALRARADATTDEAARRRDLVRIAKVTASTAGDAGLAIDAWKQVEATFGRSDDSVDALAELYAEASRFAELEALLAEAVADAGAGSRRAELLRRLGDHEASRKADPASALTRYAASLADDPHNEGARAGLSSMVTDEKLGKSAIDALVESFARADDWAASLDLLEHRLRVAASDEARAEILLEAAAAEERRRGSVEAAQRALGRALSLVPMRDDVEAELLRLAGASGDWAQAAQAYERALASLEAAPPSDTGKQRASALRMAQGGLLEARLGDLPAALAAYAKVRAEAPATAGVTEAVVRVASRLASFDEVASALVDAAAAQGSLSPSLPALVEASVDEKGSWDDAVAALELALEAAEASLSPRAAHDIFRQIGRWHRDRRGDAQGAEKALEAAAARDGSHVDTLAELADLQRAAPGKPLIATLERLSAARGGDLSALREAADVALSGADASLGAPLLSRLLETARGLWAERPDEASAAAAYAIDRLVEVHTSAGDVEAAVELLTAGASLPFEGEAPIALLRRAASLCDVSLGDRGRAKALYREGIRRAPADEASIAALAALLLADGSTADLLALRRHELGLAPSLERRLELRLAIAELSAVLGDEAGRVEALRENLAEKPGHPASVEVLGSALEASGRHRELADELSAQAARLEEAGEGAEARALWVRAGEIAEQRLGDAQMALDAQGRAQAIAETDASLDALARLHVARGEHAQAVPWLERRLARLGETREASEASEGRTEVVLRLSAALAGAGREAEARAHLEAELERVPRDRSVRAQLASLYRASEAYPALVSLLLRAAEHEDEAQAKIALYLEAADLQQRRLASPSEAVELLRRASSLAPHDRALRAGLADALRGAGQLDEARKLLEGLIDEYGRRRPPERATVHYQLAQLARARGDVADALSQLDTAASMDMAHAGVLELLGELACEAGQLERAERAYRALLLTLRRQRPDGSPASQGTLSQSEVLVALYRIAQGLSQTERASELLESAFEASAHGPQESARLERALRAAGDHELLLRAQKSRLSRARSASEEAQVLAEIALTLEAQGGREAEAFDARLRALSLSPDSPEAHDALAALAQKAGLVGRYAEHLERLAEGADRSGDGRLAASLWVRLGSLLEQSDPHRALAAYGRVGASGDERRLEALRSIDRLAAAAGDRPARLGALRSLAEALAESPDPTEHVEVLYKLAELELESPETDAQGAQTLSWALDRDPQLPRALALLRSAAERSESAQVVSLFERVSRQLGDEDALLDALERGVMLPSGSIESAREASELAARRGEGARAEALLRRAVELGESGEPGGSGETGPQSAVWAMVAIAERRKQSGDARAALDWLSRAADAAPEGESFRIGLEAAQLAETALGDLALAARSYDKLWRRDPGDRRAWEPLLSLLRKLGREDDIEAVVAATAPSVIDSADRRRLRLERAQLLLARPFREDDAAAALNEMLDDDPDDAEATALLLDLLERTGRSDDLAQLLARQLDGARMRRDLAQVAQLSLRLAHLMGPSRRDEAMAALRDSLSLSPDDRPMLEALLALFKPGDDPRDKAQVLERLLAHETGAAAEKASLELADLHQEAGDEDGVERALAAGAAASPGSAKIRARLERWLSDRGAWDRLAALLVDDASRRADASAALADLRRAVEIYRAQLGDEARAADALRRSRALAPGDLALLSELCQSLAHAGDHDAAIAEASQAIDAGEGGEAARPSLLRLRAHLLLARGSEADACADLDQALTLGDRQAAPELIAALDRRRARAQASGDTQVERQVTLRLCDLLSQAGEHDRSRDVLAAWAHAHPDDRDALRALLGIDARSERWDAVATAARNLLRVEQGEARVEVALRLAEACARLGRPDEAREPLEAVYHENPANAAVRDHLRKLYEQAGLARELAAVYLGDAQAATDDQGRFEAVRKAGELYLSVGDATSAAPAFEAALGLRPGDHDATIHLVDSYTALGRLQEATGLIEAAIATHKNRRSPQLSALQHRMARVAYAAGDRTVEMAWLGVALDSDMQNGLVASELADVSMEFGQWDVALKALRAITMMKSPGPMTKAQAYLRQGIIAYNQGDPKKAVVLAKKAQSEDPNLGEVRQFLDQIGEK